MSGLTALLGGFGLDSLNATLGAHPVFLAGLALALGVALLLGRLGRDDDEVPSRDELLDLAEKYEE